MLTAHATSFFLILGKVVNVQERVMSAFTLLLTMTNVVDPTPFPQLYSTHNPVSFFPLTYMSFLPHAPPVILYLVEHCTNSSSRRSDDLDVMLTKVSWNVVAEEKRLIWERVAEC